MPDSSRTLRDDDVAMRNVSAHKVEFHGVFITGGDVGFIAALIATIFPVVLAPLLVDGVDVWTFFKAVSSVLLGNSVVDQATGFEAGPVLIGVGMHLFAGALIGSMFAVALSYFDLDEMVPVVVVMMSLFGVYTFMLAWLPLSKTIVPALDKVPVLFAGWMIVTFAVLLGVGIEGWRSKWDESACPRAELKRNRWMLIAHERAIAATFGTLVIVLAGLALWQPQEVRIGVLIPYLAFHLLAAVIVAVHTRSDMKVRARIAGQAL
jgi:hypothetical protein